MSIKGGSYQRFLRALDAGNPTLVRAAAAELPQVGLEDALAVCLVLLDAEPHRYPAAAARWHARLCLERRLELAEAQLALAALAGLRGPRPRAAVEALRRLCADRGLRSAERRLERWAARQGCGTGSTPRSE